MKRRQALKLSSLGVLSLTAGINSSCSKNKLFFNHGVASGDPLEDRVILWTRVTPEIPKPVEIILEISSTKKFSKIKFSKRLQTSSISDYTIKYDFQIKGLFLSGDIFYYRFRSDNSVSDVGRTKTLSPKLNKIKIGVFSCSNYPAGFFNAYQAAADLDDLDLWLHLGDYLYEYPMGGYATNYAKEIGRIPNPTHEVITLSDYRTRHAQYKSDKGSKALHKKAPLIAVWDDHELSNDAWKKGAKNHSLDGSEGDFFARRSSAIKAYHEWMPIREQQNKRKIFREFKIGKLMQLLMLDTRQYGRDKQIEPFEYLQESGFKQAKFYNDLNSNNKNLLGSEQLSWIQNKIASSEFNWTIIGQQVLMTKLKFPNLLKMIKKDDVPDFLNRYLRLRELGISSNLDAWDGYPAERNKLYKLMSNVNSNFISLAGDTHNSWVSELTNDQGKKIAIELGTPSVTSPGITDVLNINKKMYTEQIIAINKELKWMDPSHRGFLTLECDKDKILAIFHFINEIKKIDARIASSTTFNIQKDSLKINQLFA